MRWQKSGQCRTGRGRCLIRRTSSATWIATSCTACLGESRALRSRRRRRRAANGYRLVTIRRNAFRHRGRSGFSVLVRPRGSHAGAGLAKIDDPAAMERYLRERQEREFFISRFVDYASGDGLFRKVRIVVVDGRPYACHLAVADRWDIWYLNAGMPLSAGKRLEEETFMRTFDIGFAQRHRVALAGLVDRIGLDYFTVDCAETKRRIAADIRGRQHRHRPQHGSARRLSVQGAADATRCSKRSRPCSTVAPGNPGEGGMTTGAARGIPGIGSERDADPKDWDEIRAQGHRMLDDMIDYVATIRERPVWRPIPDEVRARFRTELPRQPSGLGEVYREFADFIAPYATGNVHPGFMGWVHGGGTPSACWRKCWRPD